MIYPVLPTHVKNITEKLCAFVLLLYFCHIYYSIDRDTLKFRSASPDALSQNVANYDTAGIKRLKRMLEDRNVSQNISNVDKYGLVCEDTLVLLVQVRRDVRRLRALLRGLARARDMHKALLVLSHGYYDSAIQQLVGGIRFCRVMQIFYPHSLQLNPHSFPGVDVEDCSPGTDSTDCSNRDAALAEHKQHWWWKANFVFRRMKWSSAHRAPVVFLEETDSVAPDVLHMLQHAQRFVRHCPQVEIISLGGPLTDAVDMDSFVLEPWRPALAVGLAFNKSTWTKMASISERFCLFDDLSWSSSLANLLRNFPRGYASAVSCATPRVISTAEFENPENALKKFASAFHPSNFFPKKVHVVFLFGRNGIVQRASEAPRVGGGGWRDLRDQLLCLDPLFATPAAEQRYDEPDFTIEYTSTLA